MIACKERNLPSRHPALLRALAALSAALACSTAAADVYTLTTRTEGPTSAFNLPGLFPQGDLTGARSFDLTVTSVFDSANVLSSADNNWMQASDAKLEISMRLDGAVYSLTARGQVSSQILSDTDGTGNTTKRFYQTISFDPATFGDFATVQQYVFLDADQLAIKSVLEPATAYYANPLAKGFSIVNSNILPDGDTVLVGDAVGRADQFHYNLAVAVPEPATYAMFAAGLGVLAAGARRRRARAA